MAVLTGYRHISEAIERWRAAGLYLPCDSEGSRRRLQQVWLERYQATEAALFLECVKVLAAGARFPRLYDMDAALAEARARHKLQARITAARTEPETVRPDYDVTASKKRINEIIDHLQNRFTIGGV